MAPASHTHPHGPLTSVHTSTQRTPLAPRTLGFGRALSRVGCVAAAYHASSGRARVALRKADYWSIAAASTSLRASAVTRVPRGVAAALAALTLVKPTLVTGANFLAVEVNDGIVCICACVRACLRGRVRACAPMFVR